MTPTASNDRNIQERERGQKNALAHGITIPETIRSEVNLLVLPFFALWDKDIKRRTETTYNTIVTRGQERLEIAWTVSSNPRYGYPGPFDKEVHKAIEQIISELPIPVENPIHLGSIYSLYKRMGINKVGGAQYRRIKSALWRIMAATIESKGTFYSRQSKKWIEDVFHLYDRVIFRGEEFPNGDVAEDNYLFLNSWYLDNINANYVKPVDWSYYRTLSTPIAQRLYELLSVKFYGLLISGGHFLQYRYSTICELLPIARQTYLSDVRSILDPAHQKLCDTGFINRWDWQEVDGDGKEKDWLIKYYPGKRARDEIKRFSLGEQLELELPPQKEAKVPVGDPELSTEDSKIVAELVQRGITKTTATRTVRDYPIEQIQRHIEVFDWLKEIRSQRVGTNAPGFLRKSIEEDYQLPDEYIKHHDRQTKQQEADNIKERWLQHREKLIDQDLADWDKTPPEERVRARLDAWVFTQSRPNQDAVDSMRQELIGNLPKTNEEKREYIALNYPEDPLPDFK